MTADGQAPGGSTAAVAPTTSDYWVDAGRSRAVLAKGFAAVFYGPFVKEEPAAADPAAAGSEPAGEPAGSEQPDPPDQSDHDDPDVQTGATSESGSPEADGSVSSNESGPVCIAAGDRDAYAALLRQAATLEKEQRRARHKSIYVRAFVFGFLSLAATTAFGNRWLGLSFWGTVALVACELLYAGIAIKCGVPRLPPFSGRPTVFGSFSYGGRLLAVAAITAVLGITATAFVVEIGHAARAKAAGRAPAPSTVTSTRTVATTTTTPTRTVTSTTVTTTMVTRTPASTTATTAALRTTNSKMTSKGPEYGPAVWRVLVGGGLGLLAAIFMYLLTLGTNIIWASLRDPDDPYSILLVALLHANGQLATALANVDPLDYGTLPAEQRQLVVEPLDRAARYAPGAALSSPVGGDVGDDTAGELRDRAGKLAAWLDDRQAEVLWPAPTYRHLPIVIPIVEGEPPEPEENQRWPDHPSRRSLAVGLVAACRGDWDAIASKPRPPEQTSFQQQVRKFVPRALLAAVLALVAFVLPDLLFAHSDTARGALQVTLLGIAVGALATPADALGKASDSVVSAVNAAGSSG